MDRNQQPLVTVFGGSGFVGARIVQLLARDGWRIRVAVRRPDLAFAVRPLGNVGQIVPVQANIRNADSIRRAVVGAEAVINLVGVGYERGAQTFRAVHVDGARRVAEAATEAGARTFAQMSALGADTTSLSAYARSKAEGEIAVSEAFPDAVMFRPSLIFGPGDGFFNMMGTMSRFFPVMPLIGGKTLFQPAYVGDVADAFVLAANGTIKAGRVYELGGPQVLTHRALIERILKIANRKNPLLPLPAGIARLLALPFSILPWPPLLTSDQVSLLAVDNIVSESAIADRRTFAGLGITPTAMDAVLSSYLWRFRKNGQFEGQAA